MSDVHTKAVRSYNMSRIKSKNTKPEMLVRKFLFSEGYRYRLHVKQLKGSPDIVLKKHKTLIFINGCFWHGHENCRYAVIPKSRTEWWKDKIQKTAKRDIQNYSSLSSDGWNIIIIWECDLKPDKRTETLENLIEQLTGFHKPQQ
jgi:DNA mismatch endonuclease, patch repair protein